MSAYKLDSETDHRLKPDGGYVHISTFRFGIAWWCYLQGFLSIRAVRVLLALSEVGIRRAAFTWSETKRVGVAPDFSPTFTTGELGRLCGLPEKKARAALKELLALGLVAEFSSERIVFAQSIAELALSDDQRSEFWGWFGALTKRKRIPIPRRILTLACESSSSAQIAFILGATLRCIYLHPKDGGFTYSGWLSLSWLSVRFGVSLRALKSAKAHLVGLGWVSSAGRIGRWGQKISINPAWNRIDRTSEAEHRPSTMPPTQKGQPSDLFEGAREPHNTELGGPKSAPHFGRFGPKSAPPITRESSFGTEIQRPRESPREGPPKTKEFGLGIFQNAGELKPNIPRPGFSPPVRLSKITPEDFKDVGRALELFRQAVKCGLTEDGENPRLRWMAAIERARTVPAKNPAGVFLHIIKNRLWNYLSDGHWFSANERLKIHLFGARGNSNPSPMAIEGIGSMPSKRFPSKPNRPVLSKDAELIKTMRHLMARRGLRNLDVLPLLRREDPSWTRDRVNAAELEIARPNYLEVTEKCSTRI